MNVPTHGAQAVSTPERQEGERPLTLMAFILLKYLPQEVTFSRVIIYIYF